MSNSVERFIASTKVKSKFADDVPAAAKTPSAKPAPQQEAAAGSGKGSVSMEDAAKAIGTNAACSALHCHVYYYIGNAKFCKKRAGLAGTKIYRGAHFDEVDATGCLACDRGQHRGHGRGKYYMVQRAFPSPRGVNKKKQERAARREAKEAAKAEPVVTKLLDRVWRTVDGAPLWIGDAVDGVGHHDGGCEYVIEVSIEDFRNNFIAGSEARWTMVNGGDPEQLFALPDVAPSGAVKFRVRVCSEGSAGRVCIFRGLEVRPRLPLA